MCILYIEDIAKMISQYSPRVYCTLRLVNKEVKANVDKVLPCGEHCERNSFWNDWRTHFLYRAAHSCGFELMDRTYFDGWVEAMYIMFADVANTKENGAILEKFFRDYLPMNGTIERANLNLLCICNRKEYVREMWNEAVDKKSRFYPTCIQSISMLDDVDLVNTVYEFFKDSMTLELVSMTMQMILQHYRWKNALYFLEKYPFLKEDTNLLQNYEEFFYATTHWDNFVYVVLLGNDKENVMKLLNQDGMLLWYVDERLKSDKDVVMVAVKQEGSAIRFASGKLQKDRDIIMEVAKQGKYDLEFVFGPRKADKGIFMESVKHNGFVLEFADASLQKDKDVVLEAIQQNGLAIQYADESLRKNKEIVMIALKQNIDALRFADQSLRKDKEIVMKALLQNGYLLECVDESLRKDKEVVMIAVKQNGFALASADESLRKDKEVVLEAVKQNGEVLEYADKSLRKDKDVALAAVTQNGNAFQYIDESLRGDTEILMANGIMWKLLTEQRNASV